MSDWNPSIVVIENVINHPNADRLDIATVLGDYPVIVKRDEYKVGDVACYLPIDTIVPDTEQFYFLSPKAYEKYEENGEIKQRQAGNKYPVGSVPERYRILKAKKILNVYSQGMLIPAIAGLNVGDSVVDVLGLKKHEEEEEENVQFKKPRGANAAAPPKGFSIPYYDIESLRKYTSCLAEGEEVVLSEKIHGSNAGFCFDGEKLWSKSRNFYKKDDPDDMWIDIANRYDLANKLSKYPMFVFFGEIYGQVKGFRYDTTIVDGQLPLKIRFFDIWNAKTMRYVDYDEFVAITTELGLDVAPELYRGPWTNKNEMYPYAEGMSTLNPKHVREGFVLRTAKERYEPHLNSRMQVKLVGQGYNLQK